ncbi:MAG: sigma-70 family RNA polymerase sigma factor [Clostridia bacterium]|nr:sigma-70 family RNA polymerase sigma factor [Clostridia bacterium]
MDDTGITDLLFERSEQGLREIEKIYGARMRGLAVRICGSLSDADEIVNDCLKAVWDSVPPERPDPLSTYLLRIVRNLSCKRVRERNAGKRSGILLPIDELAEELPSPEDGAALSDSAEIARAIDEFLEGCSETDRLLFVRRFWYSDSVKELASESGLSRAAVSDRLSRMKKGLADMLARRGIRI